MSTRISPSQTVRIVASAAFLAMIFVSEAGANLGPQPMPLDIAVPSSDAALLQAPAGGSVGDASEIVGAVLDDADAPTTWLDGAEDRFALVDALAQHPEKVPVEFYDHLQYALPDGTLRVIGRVTERNAVTEADVAANTVKLAWYEGSDAFLATFLPDHFTAALNDPAILFLEPDFPLTYFLSQSTLDIHARSKTGTGTGVWYWDATTGSFKSDVSSLTTAITGSSVTAAIIDSGVDRTHKDFSGTTCTPSDPLAACDSRIKLSVKAEEASSQFVQLYPSDELPTTDLASGHGTHVSGIVAGNGWYSRHGQTAPVSGGDGLAFGVAPEASLVVVTNGDTLWAGQADNALNWVKLNHATYGIKVTSNSWGCIGGCAYDASSFTSTVVHDLYDLGIVSVFAAGNDGGTGTGGEFSGYAQSPYVIGVAAYDRSDKLASFSSRGSSSASNTLPAAATWTPGGSTIASQRRPDVAAPGVGILSARSLTGGAASLTPRLTAQDVDHTRINTVTGPYVAMDGTSMATPHVTGAVVLLFDECPTAAPLDIMRAIFAGADSTGVKKTGSTTTAEPFEVGYGQLDIRASLDWLMSNVSGC